MKDTTSISAKIQRAVLILGGANYTAAIVFFVFFLYSGENLIALAAGLMAAAGTGIFILGKKMQYKMKDLG